MTITGKHCRDLRIVRLIPTSARRCAFELTTFITRSDQSPCRWLSYQTREAFCEQLFLASSFRTSYIALSIESKRGSSQRIITGKKKISMQMPPFKGYSFSFLRPFLQGRDIRCRPACVVRRCWAVRSLNTGNFWILSVWQSALPTSHQFVHTACPNLAWLPKTGTLQRPFSLKQWAIVQQ